MKEEKNSSGHITQTSTLKKGTSAKKNSIRTKTEIHCNIDIIPELEYKCQNMMKDNIHETNEFVFYTLYSCRCSERVMWERIYCQHF